MPKAIREEDCIQCGNCAFGCPVNAKWSAKDFIDEAVKEGLIKLYDGMMTDEPMAWEERDGALYMEVGEGMSDDGWVKISDGDGYILFMTTRYVRAE